MEKLRSTFHLPPETTVAQIFPYHYQRVSRFIGERRFFRCSSSVYTTTTYTFVSHPRGRGCSIKFLSTRSVQRRPRYPLVVARRRSTANRRGQKEGGAPWRHVAGGPSYPYTVAPCSCACRCRGTRVEDVHQYVGTKVEGGAHRRPPRLLTVDSIAGGVLMEAEICDLDELTSGQRGFPLLTPFIAPLYPPSPPRGLCFNCSKFQLRRQALN